MTSKGSKPRSSSCCLVEEPKPNAACQSVDDDTGMVSVGMRTNCCQIVDNENFKKIKRYIHYSQKWGT